MNFREFTAAKIPIPEMEEFYQIPKDIPSDRPWVWYMFVHSADGKGSFKEPGDERYSMAVRLSGPGIAGAHLSLPGAPADYRLLQYGWATADAVLGGTGIIAAEPKLIWRPTQQDLVEYREQNGKGRAPVQVVMTGRGLSRDVLGYDMFTSKEVTTLIATSKQGYDAMKEHGVDDLPVQVEVFGDTLVDIPSMLKRLRTHYDVEILDLQGGPRLADQFLKLKLIDDYRTTRSPLIVGSQNSKGEQRPGVFEGPGFGLDNPPLTEILAVRAFGNHLYFREKFNYELFKGE